MAPFTGKTCSIITITNNYYASVLFFLLFFSLAEFSLAMQVVHGSVDRPTLFIFGDSTFDVGTNNFLGRTKAKANFLYNGIDYPYAISTGRFSNGYNTADQIARRFGYMESPPAFLALKKRQYGFKRNILQGVNFASGGSGILRKTGLNVSGEVVCLEEQVKQFALVRSKIDEVLGPAKAADFVSKALFLISVGSNDLFDFAHNASGSIRVGAEQYMAILQFSYYFHITNLYNLGARKFGILGIAPIGCCPAITSGNGGKCLQPLNDFATAFYEATDANLQKLSSALKGFKYSLANTFLMTKTLLDTPSKFGLTETQSACCGIGFLNGHGPCNKSMNANLCSDRKEYLFWDWFHPTERASELAAGTLYGGGTEFVAPVNLSQLAQA